MLLAVSPLATVGAPISPSKCAFTVELEIDPLAKVRVSVREFKRTFAALFRTKIDLVLFPIAFVAVSVVPVHATSTVLLALAHLAIV